MRCTRGCSRVVWETASSSFVGRYWVAYWKNCWNEKRTMFGVSGRKDNSVHLRTTVMWKTGGR